jgi:hypothetical protein
MADKEQTQKGRRMKLTKEAIAEIKAIEDRQGRLTPEQIVDAAQNTSSALHGCFCWDDSEAAHKYRIEQARELLKRVKIAIEYHETTIRVVGYVRDPDGKRSESQYRATMRITKRGAVEVMEAELSAIAADMQRAFNLAVARSGDLPGLADRINIIMREVNMLTGDVASFAK